MYRELYLISLTKLMLSRKVPHLLFLIILLIWVIVWRWAYLFVFSKHVHIVIQRPTLCSRAKNVGRQLGENSRGRELSSGARTTDFKLWLMRFAKFANCSNPTSCVVQLTICVLFAVSVFGQSSEVFYWIPKTFYLCITLTVAKPEDQTERVVQQTVWYPTRHRRWWS